MALRPMFLSTALINRLSRILDHHFASPLFYNDPFFIRAIPKEIKTLLRSQLYEPWKITDENIQEDKFRVDLDVKSFKPEEITVKMTGINEITIEGKHEEKEDENGGFVSRHFLRRYTIPDGHDLEKISSQLSSDGVLSIVAPKIEKKVEHREIPITRIEKTEDRKP